LSDILDIEYRYH